MAHLLCCIRARDHMKDAPNEKRKNTASASDSLSSDSGHVIDLTNMEATGYQKRQWDRVLEEESRKLKAQTPASLRGAALLPVPTTIAASRGIGQQQHQLALAEECLQRLTTQYNQRGWSGRVSIIRDIFESVQPFTVAVNTVVQASDAAAISWGCLTLVFTAVLRFASFWDELQSLLQDLTTTLPRLHAYTDIYHTPRLHSTLRTVYCRFNGICLKTQAYLNEACFAAVMKLQWTAFAQTFKRESGELQKATNDFEKEVALASHQVQKTRHAEILANLTTIQQHTMSGSEGNNGSGSVVEQVFVSNIHLYRNEKFAGRDDILAQIHAYLHLTETEQDATRIPGTSTGSSVDSEEKRNSKPRALCSCLVHAIGGMGKTEVALEYTYRFRALYTHIFWVRAGSPELLARSYEEIFDEVGRLTDNGGDEAQSRQLSQAQKVQGTLDWLRTTTNSQWLLVFDNAEDLADIRPFWPASPTGSIIITSQNPELSQLTKWQVPLRPLQAAEGARLVQSYLFRGGSEHDAASKLSAALGGLPLAIVHFVGYIARSQCPIDEIAESLKERLQSSQIWDMADGTSVSASTRAYEHSLATVWDLALHRLSPDARFLMETIAFLDPDHLPVDLFSRRPSETLAGPNMAEDGNVDSPAWKYWEPSRFNDAISMLCQRNLVERYMSPDGNCLKTHRMLQRSILQRLDKTPDQRQAVFDQVVSILRRSVPKINIIGRSDNTQFAVYAKYLPQLLVLHQSSNLASNNDSGASRVKANLGFVELVADFGFYCRTQDETTALPVLRSAEAACAAMEKDHEGSSRRRFLKLRADILSLISIIVKPRGKAGQAEAFAYLDRIIEIRRAELEGIPREAWTEEQATNHHRALVDMALTLCYADRVEEAAKPMEDAEAFYASVGNETRRQHVRMQYAWVLVARRDRDAARARAYGQEAVEYMARELGAENPLTQQAVSRFGGILFAAGDLGGAKREHEISFKWRFSRYGRYHDETLGSLFCLAVCKQHLGDLKGAEEDLRTILEQDRTSEEWRDADVYRVKYRLFLVLELQNRRDEAGQVWREVKGYLSTRMGETEEALLLRSRREIAEVLDGDIVTLDHGRTAGIWSNGTYW